MAYENAKVPDWAFLKCPFCSEERRRAYAMWLHIRREHRGEDAYAEVAELLAEIRIIEHGNREG